MAVSSAAQQHSPYLPSSNGMNSETAADDHVFFYHPVIENTLPPQPAQSGAPGSTPPAADNGWHFSFSPYLWFA